MNKLTVKKKDGTIITVEWYEQEEFIICDIDLTKEKGYRKVPGLDGAYIKEKR